MAPRHLLLILLFLSSALDLTEGKKKKKKKAKPAGRAFQEEDSSMVILVDDVEDRIQAGGDSRVPQCEDCRCSTTSFSGDAAQVKVPQLGEGENGCTLRGALEMASGLSDDSAKMRIVMRPGRFRLRAPLPEVTSVVELVGAPGRVKPRPKPKQLKTASPKAGEFNSALVEEKERKRREQKRADEMDDVDGHFHGGQAGQTAAVGTVIDGEQRFQIFRTSAHSELRLRNVRLEDGRAVDRSTDPRAVLGGAINAFGKLVLSNVVMRNNRAINGGGLASWIRTCAKSGSFAARL